MFQRVINVIDHFEPYNHIEQIAELSARVKKIKNELCTKVRKDFEESFSNPFTKVTKILVNLLLNLINVSLVKFKMNVQKGSDLCKIVDVLDVKMKTELIKWFLKQELNEYAVLFEENQENAWLDKIDRRYSWIKRTLAEFEEKFGKIFPAHWDMSERLAVEFCEVTRFFFRLFPHLKFYLNIIFFKRRELSNVMGKRRLEIDNKLLMFAIQRTLNFEQLLTTRFLGRSIPKPNANQEEISDEEWKPFMGIISQCFDSHFDVYINFTDS